MAMCKQGDVSLCGAGFGDNPIDPRADPLRRLPARAAVTKNQPVRSFGVNLLWRKPFVLPIVPLQKIALDVRTFAESRELAGFAGPLQRTGKNQREGLLGENGLEKPRSRTSVVRERNIRDTRML